MPATSLLWSPRKSLFRYLFEQGARRECRRADFGQKQADLFTGMGLRDQRVVGGAFDGYHTSLYRAPRRTAERDRLAFADGAGFHAASHHRPTFGKGENRFDGKSQCHAYGPSIILSGIVLRLRARPAAPKSGLRIR